MSSTWYSNEKYANVRQGAQRTYRVTKAAAELAISADGARRQQGVGAVRGGADVTLKYRNFKSEAGLRTTPMEEKLFRLAGDTLTVTGGVLSAIALPTMAKKTATSFRELSTLIHDPSATADARLDKVEELARSSAGTIFSAQGVVMGAKGTIGILSRSEGVARVVSTVNNGKFMRFVGSPLGKALNILLPIADVAVLVGETIAARRTFNDPAATGSQKLRKVLNLGLAGVKVAFWVLPGAKALKTAYNIASFGQLALTLKDYWPQIQPNVVKVAKAVGWGILHPFQAAGKIAEGTLKGVGWVASKVGAFAGWAWDKLSHPAQTWNTLWTEVSTWTRAYTQATGRQISHWFGRDPLAPAQPGTQIAYTPPVQPGVVPAPAPAVPPSPADPYAVAASPAVPADPDALAAAPPTAAPPPPPPAPAPAPPAPAPAPLLAATPTVPVPQAPAAAPAALDAPVVAQATPTPDPLAQIRQAAEAAAAA